MEDGNRYETLDLIETMTLIAARGNALVSNPDSILTHIHALLELARHYDDKYYEWKHQLTAEHAHAQRDAEQFQREVDEFDDTQPKLRAN